MINNKPIINNILVCYWGRKGGGAKYSEEILRSFVKICGNKIYASFSKNSEIYNNILEITSQTSHITTFNNKFQFILKSLLLPITLIKLILFIKSKRIDLVYTPMGHVWTPFLSLLLNVLKIKHVYTVHDASTHPGDFSIPDSMIRYVINNSHKIVVLSPYVKKQVQQKYNLSDNKIISSIHGILRYNKISECNKIFDNNKLRIVFFGRILKYKGLKHILSAQIEIEKKCSDILLEIYGSGDISDYKEEIKNIKNIKLENKWISDEDIHKIFEKPCINVAPYIEASQSGTIPVALSCGIPTICTNVGGLSDQIINEQTGIVIDVDNAVNELVKNILYLYHNKDILNNMSLNCINYVKEYLEWDNISTQILNEL